MFKKGFIAIYAAVLFGVSAGEAADSRITLPSGKKIFLSGMNLAWINFANDVGDTPLDTTRVGNAMKAIADSGANCMRIWLSTTGQNDPKYDANGLVSGPGSQTIANIQKMLKLGKKYNILVMPVLLTHGWVRPDMNATILANNIKMLQTEAGLKAYIDNYVKPVVTAIGNDPNLVCWEVCNEPEGMYQQWNNKNVKITQLEIQRLVNWVASAIHQAVPKVLVSNGSAGFDFRTWYTDAALKGIQGAKQDGTLDFYMIHYYGWNGAAVSPFRKPCSYWNLDKPMVIGEFASTDWSNATQSSTPITDGGEKVDTLMKNLDNNGYAGGLGWQYQPDAGDPWMKGFATFGHALAEVYRMDSNSIKLAGNAGGNFAISASSSNGGTVTKSITGRVDSLKEITLTAVASAGYTFKGWTGDTTSTAKVLVIKSVVKDWSVHANFTPDAGTNLIKSGDFSDPSAWSSWADNIDNDATISFENSQANVTITKADTVNWKIQVAQLGIPITNGETLVLTFDAWSSAQRKLHVGMTTATTYNYQGGEEVLLKGEKQSFTVEFTCDTTCATGVVQFNCGNSTLPVFIDNVSLVKKSSAPVRFLTDHQPKGTSVKCIGDKIFWNCSMQNVSASLAEVNGRIIRSELTTGTVNIASLPSGRYLFIINAGNNKTVYKFTKR